MRMNTISLAGKIAGIMATMMLVFVSVASAQYLTLSVDRNSILLGEHFRLEVKLTAPAGATISNWPVVPDSVNHLEVIERGKVDSIRQGDKMIYQQQVTMTGFDSGHWVIPAMAVAVNGKEVKSASTAIDVQNIKLTGSDYNDIKEIIEVEPPGPDWKKILLYVLGVALILALAYYWWKNRRARPVVAKPVSRGAAYEEAMKALAALKQDNLLEKGEMKKYYTRLYDIYRVYLEGVTGMSTVHKTTDDLLLIMKPMLSGQMMSSAAEVLRIADAVKFAKYIPPREEGSRSMENIRQSIDELNRQKQ